ncbi:MAG: ATP-binding protein [Gemmatimonadales bacterium]|nr:ATP-binding protein [Gemmatimonadales bacterium]
MNNSEDQHTEWKSSWRDDYLKWVCGFANAGGGRLVIGRNDRGQVTGIPDARRLLELLPNKVRDVLGILVDVNLLSEDGKEYLEIKVGAYPNPISYSGEYYQRSGSTNQLLKGAALDRFLLRRYGRTWDGSPLPGVAVSDLSPSALSQFRKLAERSGRLDSAALKEPDAALLDKLKLTEGDYLKRAAVLLFHPDPERFVTGASIKIGYFASESDLRYHDVIAGDLFTQVGKSMELLLTKYLKAVISYEGIHRIESFPMPEPALREALVNAVVHRDYLNTAPIQIRVYDDRLVMWNPAVLPEGWTQQTLLGSHTSQPQNPDVANTFFRAGEVEAWGRGIERMFAACRNANTPEPQIRFDAGGIWTEFVFSASYLGGLSGKLDQADAGTTPVKTPVKTPDRILDILASNPDLTLAEVAQSIGKSLSAVERASAKLAKQGRLRFVGPRKGGHWVVPEDPDEKPDINPTNPT